MIEWLKVFDENYNEIGIEQREIIHANGYWHEVFHCWVIEKIHSEWHIYFQLRSKNKKDYPNQFDITAAGHLLATETIEDGVRELAEELGIHAEFTQLHSLGVIPYRIANESIKDFEFANVFLYKAKEVIKQITIQREEVDGIYSAKLADFIKLTRNEIAEMEVTGYEYINDLQHFTEKNINLQQMATLPSSYLDEFIPRLIKLIKEESLI